MKVASMANFTGFLALLNLEFFETLMSLTNEISLPFSDKVSFFEVMVNDSDHFSFVTQPGF